MRRGFVLVLVAIASILLLSSCRSTDRSASIEKSLVGRWMLVEVDGKEVTTNDKIVYRFRYDKEMTASLSLSIENGPWIVSTGLNCTIKGDSLSVNARTDEQMSIVIEHIILNIAENEFECLTSVKTRTEGKPATMTPARRERWIRVPVDYRSAIIGIWEGHMTSESSTYDTEGATHRWEFWKDGSYVYYDRKEDGSWDQAVNRYSDYFVDGRLLCMRWANQDRVEKREWWEIESVKDGVMNWKALRKAEDGSTYTASFTMKRVTK